MRMQVRRLKMCMGYKGLVLESRQSSLPVIDVDRDRLWGDGLAASSPVGLCRKFRREESQKAKLERKIAAVEHRDVQHRVSGFEGFRSSATRLSVHPLQLRGSRSLRKSPSQL